LGLIDRVFRHNAVSKSGVQQGQHYRLIEDIARILGGGGVDLGKGKLTNASEAFKVIADIHNGVVRRAEAIASLPMRFYTLRAGQRKPWPEDSAPATLLTEDWGEPWKGTTAYKFKFQLSAWLDLKGTAYIQLLRGAVDRIDGEPLACRIVPHWAILEARADGSMSVRVSNNETMEIPRENILKLESFSTDGHPLALVDVLRVTAGDIEYQRVKEEIRRLQFGIRNLIALEIKGGPMTEAQQKQLREQFQERNGGTDSNTGVVAVSEGTKITPIGESLESSQHLGSREYAAQMIYRSFGIPPILGDISDAQYDSADTQREVFWENTILPIVRDITATLNIGFCPLYHPDLIVRFDTTGIPALQKAHQAVWDTAQKMRTFGLPIRVISDKLQLDLPNMAGDNVGDYHSVAEEPRVTTVGKPITGKIGAGLCLKSDALPYRRAPESLRKAAAFTFLSILGKAEDGTGFEGRYKTKIGKLLRQQEKAVLEHLPDTLANLKLTGEAKPYDRSAWLKDYTLTRRMLGVALWKQGAALAHETMATMTGKKMKADATLDPTGGILKEIERRAAQWAELQDDYTWTRAGELLQQSFTDGWELTQTREALGVLFSEERLTRIARTETLGSMNFATDSIYRNADECWGEEWLSTHDERVRDSHFAADGQVIAKDGVFTVGDAKLQYPGDPAAPAEEVIQCRCTILPVILDATGESNV
jgi:HK97 family phage portal protein